MVVVVPNAFYMGTEVFQVLCDYTNKGIGVIEDLG